MSYCRFSAQSDVHAYASEEGKFVVQIAMNATPEVSEAQEAALTPSQLWALLDANSQPLNGRLDGQSFEFDTAQAMTDRLREMAALGYRVPPDTWGHIQKDFPGVVVAAKPSAPVGPRP